MDLSSIYLSSPDWLKFVLVAAPCLMLYGITREVAKNWASVALARLQHQPNSITLMPPMERPPSRAMIADQGASDGAAPRGSIDADPVQAKDQALWDAIFPDKAGQAPSP